MSTTYWSPNQAAVAQVETYTFTVPSGVGNTYTATINGKSVTYASVSGDTAATAATGLFNLLNLTSSIAAEFTEITFANPSDGVLTATAKEPGTPFANVTVNGVAGQGLVLSTGNGLANGIATAHTTPSASPNDVNDPQNWLRVVTPGAPPVRSLPQAGDDEVVRDSDEPMLWNLDRLSSVRRNTYTRWQSMTGNIGLPTTNANGYTEWRATSYKLSGPAGSVPAGGLAMILGQGSAGGGPGGERYDVGSDPVTMTVLAANDVSFLGVHTANTFTLLGGTSLNVATGTGEVSSLASCMVDGSASLSIGAGVTWTVGSTLTMIGGSANLDAAPSTLSINGGAQVTVTTSGLTWTTVTARSGSSMLWLAGGVITTLTMENGALLDKSLDARTLTITNSTIDGDTCAFVDPLNAIVWTNATSVKQQVTSGPFIFTGTRTVKVT